MTRDSERLLELARGLIAECPAELGDEVAVTGSVGAGLADEHSDIELLFLVESVPEPARVREWLDGVSGTESVLADREDSGVWGWCRLSGVEIDPYWGLLSEAVTEVDAITSGAVLEHRRLAFAHVLIHAVQLRTLGALAELAPRCAVYPAGLRRRLIEMPSGAGRSPPSASAPPCVETCSSRAPGSSTTPRGSCESSLRSIDAGSLRAGSGSVTTRGRSRSARRDLSTGSTRRCSRASRQRHLAHWPSSGSRRWSWSRQRSNASGHGTA
jgi:hypothetical protein